MALMVQQGVPGMITPTYSTPTTSDTITPDTGLVLVVKIGGTATTVTVSVPGNQPYTGTPIADQTTGSVTSTEKWFYISPVLTDSAAGNLVTVTYSQVTGVTAGLFKVGA